MYNREIVDVQSTIILCMMMSSPEWNSFVKTAKMQVQMQIQKKQTKSIYIFLIYMTELTLGTAGIRHPLSEHGN